MKKNIRILLIIFGIWFILFSILIYFGHKNKLNLYGKDIIPQIENSKVLEKKVGKIIKVKSKFFSNPKYIGDNKGELEYIIYTQNKKYNIKVISTIENNKFVVLEYKLKNEIIKEEV